MALLHVTVVGQDLFKPILSKFEFVGLNPANELKTGTLGNLKTLTYTFELSEEEIIDKRRKLMDELIRETDRYTPMYVHGDWMRVYVFKPIRI